MKKLIFLCGSADSPFITNEICILKEYFDDVCVVSYPVSKDLFHKMLANNNIRGYMIPKWKLSPKVVRDYVKWFSLKHVRSEIKSYTSFSIKGIKRFLYILHYGLSVVNSYRFLEEELNDKSDDCDVYLYAFWMSRPSYVASFLNWMHKDKIIKAVARTHGYDLYEERSSTEYLPFRQFISGNLDEVHFISDNGRKYFDNKIRTKYNITDMPALSLDYLGTYNKLALKKVIRNKTEVVIASCSYISPIKRLDLIIDFLSMLGGISVKWVHIGDGKQLEYMKTLAKSRIPHVDIHFCGKIENDKILSVYEKEDVDFLINMSDSEGLPVSFMEAMSMGIPVIARNVGGISEIVNCQNGCLLDGISIDDREKARRFVMIRVEDVPKYQAFSENAVKTWENNFNAEINYRKFFEEMVSGQSNVDS